MSEGGSGPGLEASGMQRDDCLGGEDEAFYALGSDAGRGRDKERAGLQK